MKHFRTIAILLGIISVAALSSCDLFQSSASNDPFFGNMLEFDTYGHVEQHVTYSLYDWRKWDTDEYKYKTRRILLEPDGSYHIAEYLYESADDDLNGNDIQGEGEIVSFKEWGSYSYDADEYMLTYNRSSYKAFYDDAYPPAYTEEPAAHLFPAGSYKTETVVLTERSYAKAYVQDNLNWTYSYTDKRSQKDVYQESFKVTSGVLNHSYSYWENYIDTADPGDLHAEEIWNVEIINTNPIEGFTSPDPYVQVNGIYSSFKQRNWDASAESLGAWVDDPYQAVHGPYNKGFYRFGDVLVYDEDILDLNRGSL